MQTSLVTCTIRFFHSTDTPKFELERIAKGADLYEKVCKILTASGDFQANLFGLEFSENIEHRRWLDLNKPLKSQIPPHLTLVSFIFKIKFYENHPQKLPKGLTRTLYVYQLITMIRDNELKPHWNPKLDSKDQLSDIGALFLLVRFGKYSDADFKIGNYSKCLKTSFFSSEVMSRCPNLPQKCVENLKELSKVMVKKSDLSGRKISELAEDALFETISKVDRYGYQFYPAFKSSNSSQPIEIGVSTEKISIFQNSKIVKNLRWKDIAKLAFKNALFTVEIFDESSQDQQEMLTFSLSHYRAAKELWHTCVDHHSQYRKAQGASPVGTPPLDRDKEQQRSSHEKPPPTINGESAPGSESSSNNTESTGTSSNSERAPENKSSQNMHVAHLAGLDPSFSVSPPHFRRRNLEVIPNDRGKFGLSFEGGDGNKVTITKIDPSGAAKKCNPPLNEGDEILEIFGKNASMMTSAEITNLIRDTGARYGRLLLTVLTQVIDDTSTSSPLETSIKKIQHQLNLHSDLAASFHHLEKKKPNGTFKFAEKNSSRNRYNDVWPYDDTRVLLSSENDYINANYVRVQLPNGICLNYIAAQGPLDQTVEDFWRMIYDHKIDNIIMVTGLKERDIRKCAKYWPEINNTTPTQTNEFLIDCTSEVQSEGYTCRNLTLSKPLKGSFKKNEATTRDVCHCQYHDWPDHGVPQGTANFINFITKIREFRKNSLFDKPILVHCSAGIGRTGVVILSEACFNLIDMEEPINMISLLREARTFRAQLIQNWAQFSFVCRAALAYYELKQRKTNSVRARATLPDMNVKSDSILK